MKQAYSEILDELKQTKEIVNNPELLSEVEKRMQEEQLQVMVYGAYNAGKSTLINALQGEEIAKTGDIPTTDSVDRYQWNDIILLDTPGVNAPIAHENVTMEQLQRTAVVLFVIRDGDMDSKDIYQRLIDLIGRKKKVFIIFNNKLNEEERQIAVEHINSLLAKTLKEANLELSYLQELEIIAINLKTSLKARLEDKAPLLEISGFNILIESLKNWIIQQSSEQEKFNQFKHYLYENWFDPKLQTLKAQLSTGKRQEVEQLEREKANLQQEKNFLKLEVGQEIRNQVVSNKRTLLELFRTVNDSGQLEADIERIIYSMNKAIEDKLQIQLSALSNKYTIEQPQMENSPLWDTAGDIFKKAISDKNNLTELLKIGRSFKVPLLKGRWEKTLGRWAGRAAILLQTGIAIWDAYSSAKEQDELNDQQRQYMLELHQAVERICNDYQTNAITATDKAIDEMFNPKLDELQKQILAYQAEDNKLSNDYIALEQSKHNIERIKWYA
ncbi:GTPase [Caviibacterium pharyngocola]|uniref:G domain-containing protein n=1 Tax=Caviibacterium pharyngocola TaxID=28159 RepID=A0A2M8RWS7_9PAST|nr:GTPase [Caviibacterium pharyngocola]PJG83342.1 hypothetical protein CVP04_04255 [Caviibacterium pharyngocola]